MPPFALAAVSAAFSAASSILEKKILFRENAVAFTFAVSLFTLALSFPFFMFEWGTLSRAGLAVLFLKTALGAAAFLCVMQGIKRLEISGGLPLLVLTPILTAAACLFFLGERLSAKETAGMMITLAGTYFLQLAPGAGIAEPFKIFRKSDGYKYILAALLLFTVTSVLDKAVLKNFKVSPPAFMAFYHIFLAGITGVIFFLSGHKARELKATFSESGKLLLLLAVFTVIYRWTQIEAVKLAPVALVLSIKRTSVFFGAVIGGRLFHEHGLWRKGFATAVMLAGTFLLAGFG